MTDWINRVHFGDCLETMRRMPDGIVQTCVTSPPYFGLRDYSGGAAEIGKEKTPDEFVAALVAVFREVRRVLKDDGTLWLNIGDSYGATGGDTMSGFNARYSGTGLDGGKQAQTAASAKAAGSTPRRSGTKPKDLIGIPWMLAFALRADGWYLRQEIIWAKPNPMPESVTDRCTKSHESIFLLAKSQQYYCDMAAIKEPASDASAERMLRGVSNMHKNINGAPGQSPHSMNKPRQNVRLQNEIQITEPVNRNKRSVWTVATTPYKGAHFATFPTALIEPCILAGAPAGGVVLDPFGGSGTTAQVAQALGRKWILCELNESYGPLIAGRISQSSFEFESGAA